MKENLETQLTQLRLRNQNHIKNAIIPKNNSIINNSSSNPLKNNSNNKVTTIHDGIKFIKEKSLFLHLELIIRTPFY